MDTLIISYSNNLDEGRLKELIAVSRIYGNPIVFISSNTQTVDENVICVKKKSNQHLDYLYFTFMAIKFAMKNKEKYDIVMLDFMTSSLAGVFIKNILRNKFFVQDVRELAFPKDFEKVPGKMLSFVEGKMIKKSDIVIAANSHRADIMKRHYNIKLPYSFENIRLLGPVVEVSKFDEEKSVFRIISTGGPSVSRGILTILEAFKELPSYFELIIVGDSGEADYSQVKRYIKEFNINNVKLLKKVKSDNLYDLVRSSHVGIVHYHFNDINNIYCASGKVYEYLGCLIPIATTENPPLKEFCEKNKIGIANNNFKESLLSLYENYSLYKQAVIEFASKIDVQKNNQALANYIIEEYKKKSKNRM
ncbi:glycosyltransferase [Lysinibacillus pakistanensis]|uniref:glycosyltransferase n=1 Tax=Lysinibacillus pakistanensis TaxID=759811 RepID=UPI003D26F616